MDAGEKAAVTADLDTRQILANAHCVAPPGAGRPRRRLEPPFDATGQNVCSRTPDLTRKGSCDDLVEHFVQTDGRTHVVVNDKRGNHG